jgi:hypothetical protein
VWVETAQLETAPTKYGERKCLFICIIHHKKDIKRMKQMKDYYELPSLEHVYLEDSWVLDIQTGPDSVEITLETVLTESHPEYSDPLPDEAILLSKRANLLSKCGADHLDQ